ncbi:MAG: type II toxin-antitoxin system YoeB family toxin [Clostridia bacterium]|nr:type II toxin-antitoxin system YoeB family toxin [Clostridia bacterium]
MRKEWSDEAWEDYLYWQSQDKKTLKKINDLIKDIDRNGLQGATPTFRQLQSCMNKASTVLPMHVMISPYSMR